MTDDEKDSPARITAREWWEADTQLKRLAILGPVADILRNWRGIGVGLGVAAILWGPDGFARIAAVLGIGQ